MKSRTAQHEPPKPSPGMASDVLSVHWRMWLLECTSAHSELEVLGTEQRLLDPRLPQSLNGGIFLRVWVGSYYKYAVHSFRKGFWKVWARHLASGV